MKKTGKLVGVCNGIYHCGLTVCFVEHDLVCEHSQPPQQKDGSEKVNFFRDGGTIKGTFEKPTQQKDKLLRELNNEVGFLVSRVLKHKKYYLDGKYDLEQYIVECNKDRDEATNNIEQIVTQIETEARQQAFTEALEAVGGLDVYPVGATDVDKMLVDSLNGLRIEIRANIEKRKHKK